MFPKPQFGSGESNCMLTSLFLYNISQYLPSCFSLLLQSRDLCVFVYVVSSFLGRRRFLQKFECFWVVILDLYKIWVLVILVISSKIYSCFSYWKKIWASVIFANSGFPVEKKKKRIFFVFVFWFLGWLFWWCQVRFQCWFSWRRRFSSFWAAMDSRVFLFSLESWDVWLDRNYKIPLKWTGVG